MGSRSYTQVAYGGPGSQEWRTPRAFFDALHEKYRFTLDGAARRENALLPRYFNTFESPVSWQGERVFCNPPWDVIPPFIEMAVAAELAVFLVPSRTNCRWFHRALELGAVPEFFEGRPCFSESEGSPFDCLLLVFPEGRYA